MTVDNILPEEDARFGPLKAKTEAHWRTHNKKFVRLLESNGELEQRLNETAARAIFVLNQAEETGLAQTRRGNWHTTAHSYLRTSRSRCASPDSAFRLRFLQLASRIDDSHEPTITTGDAFPSDVPFIKGHHVAAST